MKISRTSGETPQNAPAPQPKAQPTPAPAPKPRRKPKPEPEYEEEDDEEEEEHKVVRVKRFAIKPMDVEEAVLQMELLGHSFYVFENAEDGEVNVLYQRKDGNYGLIEPER